MEKRKPLPKVASDRAMAEPYSNSSKEGSQTMIKKDHTAATAATGEAAPSLSVSGSGRARIGWGFWLRWLAATGVGVVVGMAGPQVGGGEWSGLSGVAPW
jgi:hypothetical protein